MKIACGCILDGQNGVREKQLISVNEEGYIASITPYRDIPDGKDVADWSSYYVIPGMVDCHDHLGLDIRTNQDEKTQAREMHAYTALKGIAAARAILEAGITTLRDVGEQAFIDVSWKKAIAEGDMEGPRLLIACQPLTKIGGHAWFLGREVANKSDAIRAVREQIRAGADLIKVMISGGMSTPESDPDALELSPEEICAIVEEAHRAGRPVAAHVFGGEALDVAIESGVDTIEHGDRATAEQLDKMAEKGAALVVNYGIFGAIYRNRAFPVKNREGLRKDAADYIALIERARKAGVLVATGGDTYHAHPEQEAKALWEAGYAPLEVLSCLTINGHKICGLEKMIGTIDSAKIADMVALREDPTKTPEAYGTVMAVMKAGKIVHEPCATLLH